MYIDGRQLNDVIFDHSLIVTEINFTNTLYFTKQYILLQLL